MARARLNHKDNAGAQRAALGALALGGPVRPELGPPSTAGPLRSHHAPRVQHGSSG